jgi:hypothetical protein
MNVNVCGVTDAIEAIVRAGGPVDRARLVNPEVPLDEVGEDVFAAPAAEA